MRRSSERARIESDLLNGGLPLFNWGYEKILHSFYPFHMLSCADYNARLVWRKGASKGDVPVVHCDGEGVGVTRCSAEG